MCFSGVGVSRRHLYRRTFANLFSSGVFNFFSSRPELPFRRRRLVHKVVSRFPFLPFQYSLKSQRTKECHTVESQVRLSNMAHGGGCGCKLSPAVLSSLLAETPKAQPFEQLLVGTETGDDAAVWQLDERTCLIATTDFFTPMVDDPRDFGRIAATNAISDVYAMGGTPIFALAILGMPLGKMQPELVREILEGGREVCLSAGLPVAGGQTRRSQFTALRSMGFARQVSWAGIVTRRSMTS
jgi:selenophosphate synthase